MSNANNVRKKVNEPDLRTAPHFPGTAPGGPWHTSCSRLVGSHPRLQATSKYLYQYEFSTDTV